MHSTENKSVVYARVPLNSNRHSIYETNGVDLLNIFNFYARTIPTPDYLQDFVEGWVVGSAARNLYRQAVGKNLLSYQVGIPRHTETKESDIDIVLPKERCQGIKYRGVAGSEYYVQHAGNLEISLHPQKENVIKERLLCAACPSEAIIAYIGSAQTKVWSPFWHCYLPGELISYGKNQKAQECLEESLWDFNLVTLYEIAINKNLQNALYYLTRRFMVGILITPWLYEATSNQLGGPKNAWSNFRALASIQNLSPPQMAALEQKRSNLFWSGFDSNSETKKKLLEESGLNQLILTHQ